MKIKYIHKSNPKEERIHDTEKAKRNNPFIRKTQEEFDKFTLGLLKKDMENGYILSYQIIGG